MTTAQTTESTTTNTNTQAAPEAASVVTDKKNTSVSVQIPLGNERPEAKIAGKYGDQKAFETGIRELYKARGLPLADNRELIGEKGRWTSVEEAEAEYKFLASNRIEKGDANPLTDEDDLSTILTKAGIKEDEFATRWAKDKKVSDEDLAAIKKVAPWMTRKLADQVVENVFTTQQIKAGEIERIQREIKNRAISIAGGQEQLDMLLTKFAKTLPKPVIEDLNRRLADPHLADGAVQELVTRHKDQYGANAVPIILGNGIPSGPAPISSADELMQVMAARRRGDKNAEARFNATPQAVLDRLQGN